MSSKVDNVAWKEAMNALNDRIDFTNKDLSATQESLHTTQNSLNDCLNAVSNASPLAVSPPSSAPSGSTSYEFEPTTEKADAQNADAAKAEPTGEVDDAVANSSKDEEYERYHWNLYSAADDWWWTRPRDKRALRKAHRCRWYK